MSSEWWFYHLEQPPLAAALAPLFEKCLERHWRVLVVSPDEGVLKDVDKDLWKYKNESFLPHGLAGEYSAKQPILLATAQANENGSKVLVLLNGEAANPQQAFERVMVVFADDDMTARGAARQQYKAAKDAGLTVRYFKQSGGAGWKEQKN